MMRITGDRIRRDALSRKTDDAAIVRGMLHKVTDMGKFYFMILRTTTGFLQCVYDKIGCGSNMETFKQESAVEITGRWKQNSRAEDGWEILAESITVTATPHESTPISIHKRNTGSSLETELAYRPVGLRNGRNRAVFALQSKVVQGFRDFLQQQDFTEIFTPKIVSNGAEGGANIFKMDYFGQKAYLTQSPQFYKQMMVPVYGRVFEIGPVFRAEKHNTTRHLNEYISVDLEMGFIESFRDIMEMETAMLSHCFEYLRESASGVLRSLSLELPEVTTIPAIPFTEAKEWVAEEYGRKIKDPYDLEPEEERLIGGLCKREYGSDFVFITHYPSKKRPFYAMDAPEKPKYTLSFDLLYKGMEVTTGGQRIHDYSMQVEKMLAKGLNPEDFETFLMLHRYGCPPLGGLGLGLERFCMKLLDENNIRKTSLCPRDTQRLLP